MDNAITLETIKNMINLMNLLSMVTTVKPLCLEVWLMDALKEQGIDYEAHGIKRI